MDKGQNASRKKKGREPIDWLKIKQRLDITNAAIEHAWASTPEETQRILKARAEALARESAPAEAASEYIEVVEFVLAEEHYAIESQHVRDVYPLDQLTPLPCTPPFVLGIVSLRGEILSVIDIKKFFDLPDKGLTDLNKVIVLESENMRFGILADAIVGVHRISATDIQPPLPTLTGIRADYLRGVTAGRTVVLDADRLLADENIVVQEQVTG